ncbi:MAG: aminotransferase class I/II-fold pyridoxal phosphate-dependent enzyme [Saprospiraceae bacterium]|nr:aminotransferase class I/II-fold pyridoxal phosphate-dependent enzyme [Candidatus Vicinibacter affinis]
MENQLKAQILELERAGAALSPDRKIREGLDREMQEFAQDFLDSLMDRKAYFSFESMKGKLEHPDKETMDLHGILNQLDEEMLHQGLNPASGGHLGYIPGGGLYAGALGDYLAAVCNQYAGIYYSGPGAVKLENELIRWLCRLMGFPPTAHGNLTSGGSIANLIAFTTAREAKELKAADFNKQCIYLTSQVHHCVHKAIRICGMREARTRFVAMDDRFRMDPVDLRKKIEEDLELGFEPFIIIGSAGTTDTGAVDPLNELATVAEDYHLWFHVDAAYGGFFILADLEDELGLPLQNKFTGIERADSLAIDPHKGLFLSYGLGAVLIKDTASQYKAHYYRAAYMQDTVQAMEELSASDLSPELTKHFRGLRLWIPLRLYGIEPFKAALEEKILLCRYFYEEIRKMGFEVGSYPDLSVCIYRYVPLQGDADAFNAALVDHVVRDGRMFVSSTTIHQQYWIRIAILSFRTHLREIDLYLEIIREFMKGKV